jgi:hypothetical protein
MFVSIPQPTLRAIAHGMGGSFLIPRLLPPTLGLALCSPLPPLSFVVPPSLLALPPAPLSSAHLCDPPCEQLLAVAGVGWGGHSSPRSPFPAHPHIAPLSTPQAKARGDGWGVLLWWGSAHRVGPSLWSLSFHPRSTPRAVARGPGGGWCCSCVFVVSLPAPSLFPICSLCHPLPWLVTPASHPTSSGS